MCKRRGILSAFDCFPLAPFGKIGYDNIRRLPRGRSWIFICKGELTGMRSGTMNMTEGNVRRVMIAFALPVFFSQLFQQLYSTADSLIVGNLLGKQALAAVSSSGSLLHLLTSLTAGIAMGASVVISRYFGADEPEAVSKTIHTTVAFGVAAGLFMTVFGALFAPVMLKWMGTAPDVLEGSIASFRNYFYGALPMMLYNVFTGIMTALGDSRRPLYYLLFSSVLNVLLDIFFIAVLGMGVGSAAVATSISQAASAILCYLHLRKPGTIYQVRLKDVRFHGALMREVTQMGLPTGVQNSVIAIANVLLQSYINSFGSDAMAACGTYAKLQGFAFLPITSFAMALTTFISQNLGAKEYDRAKSGAKFGIISMVILSEMIGIVLAVGAPFFASLFNSDPNVIHIAATQSRIENFFFCLLAFSHAVAGVCRGAGKATVPMLVMLLIWCVFRIIFIVTGISIVNDIRILFWAYPVTWMISSVIFLVYLLKSDWVHGFDHANSHHRMRFSHG